MSGKRGMQHYPEELKQQIKQAVPLPGQKKIELCQAIARCLCVVSAYVFGDSVRLIKFL